MTPVFPAPFGRYLLVDRLASGGMAEIFRAKLVGVEGFEKNLVIKRIHPHWSERPDFIAMLVDEAKLLVHLNHPNIVQVFELGREGATYFIAMEFVEGVDLRQLQQKLVALGRPLPPELAVFIVHEALKGLYYAHERSLKDRGRLGIVHRDVSPQNILLSFEGEVKVTDFGIAKALTQTHETQTGVLKGKYAYMSPEQALGAPLDARSDLFAAAIVLWELLFGRRLFAAGNDLETLEKVRRAEVPWPAEEEIFPGLRAALERALRARPEERFASAEDFAEALEACLPKGKRVGRRRLSEFLAAAFSSEIEDRRQQARELRQKTESFLRKTRVAPPGEEETVSLVESVTDWDPASLPPAAQSAEPKPEPPPAVESFVHPMPPPLARVGRKWGLVAAVAALVLPLAWHYWPRSPQPALPQGTATGTAQVAAPLAPTPAPESRPTAALPESGAMSPVAPGPLIFRVEPATASLKATFPGGQRQGKGRLSLEGLPAATPVQAVASLAGYEPQSRSFASPSEPSPEEHVFRLEKKAAAFGSLRVNATPWGRVSMAGYIGGSETPVTRGRIPEGRYPVSVSNSALRKTLSATAVIRAGKTTQCHADFEGRAALSCR